MRWRPRPLVQQYDLRDCGPAALASVALHYGFRIPQARLHDLVGTDIQGSELARLREAAERLGFLANAGRAKPGALDRIPLPAIAHLNRGEEGHYVVIYAVNSSRVEIGDPAKGVEKLSRADFEKEWSGGLLLLAPTERISRRKQGGGSGSLLFRLILEQRADLLTAMGCATVAALLGMATSLFLQVVVDRVLPRGDESLLTAMLLGMLAILFFRGVYGLLQSAVSIHLGNRLTLKQGIGFAQHLMGLPQRFFDTRTSGDILSRLTDIQRVRSAVGGTALSATMDAFLVLLAGSVLFLYHPGLALLTVGMVPLLALTTLLLQRPLKEAQRSMMADYGKLTTRFVDATETMRTIKGFTAEPMLLRRMEDDYLEYTRSAARIQWLSACGQSLGSALSLAGSTTLLFLGTKSVLRGDLSTGQLIFFSSMLGYLISPAQRLADALLGFQEAAVSMDRLNEIFLVEPERPGALGLQLPLTGEVELKDVTFGYEPSAPVLKDFSLKIPAGATVALVGETGSGKTTLASLICGFYVPQAGEILFDGHDLKDLDLRHVRSQMAVVFQDNYLVSGSIRENMALAGPDMSPLDLEHALKRAEAAEFVAKLPKGLDYNVGHQGQALSSGQRQRLAIARALARKPRILLLDEATSNLDSRTEQAVVRSLWEDGRTTLLIAHRLSTVRNADLIVVMDAGRIVEKGTHEELLALRGSYHGFWEAQRPTSSQPGQEGRARADLG